ncbi:MAG: hypothetical protein HWE18_07090 [Gammaproteobacteria bacterium]|nr:hypothetical protein [Gammaproteobacteria bacterium]
MGRSVQAIKIIIIWSFMLLSLQAWGATVGLLVDSQSEQIVAFKDQLQRLRSVDQIQLITTPQLSEINKEDIQKWITLGPKALNALLPALNQSKSPVLALFLPDAMRVQLSGKYQKSFSTLDNSPTLSRQLALIQAIAPQAKQVGVFYSSQYRVDQKAINSVANQYDLKLQWAELKDPLDWDRQALKVLSDVDLVLGVSDDALYNTTTIRSILMRLYRSGIALVGPDKGYVRAGAVASVYSGIPEVLKASSAWLAGELADSPIIPNPYFDVSVNGQVARSLNIVVDDEASLTKQVKEVTRAQ